MIQQITLEPEHVETATAPVLVVLCSGLPDSIRMHFLSGNGSRPSSLDEAVEAVEIEDACHRPSGMRKALQETLASHVVIVACSQDYPELELHAAARKAGIDPLGLQVVYAVAGTIDGALAGAIARARAFPGSRPENLKAKLAASSQTVSRRSLFTLPPVSYAVVPTIDTQICVTDNGCRACGIACPMNAISSDGNRVTVDRSLCQSCGACVAVCPERAVELPGSSADEIEAEVTALLATTSATAIRRVAFTCSDASPSTVEGWLQVRVPCVSTLPASALLATLAAGAEAVGFVGCTRSRSHGYGGLRGKPGYARELLATLGGVSEAARVTLLGPDTCEEVSPWREQRSGSDEMPVHIFGKGAAAEAVTQLAERYNANGLALDHEASPVGVVTLDEQACSGCWTCAGACPTGALNIETDGDEVSLAFDPSLCTACGECARVCPEAEAGAINVDKRTDLAALTQGTATLHRDVERRCEGCGAAIASAGMLRRLTVLLGDDAAVLTDRLGRFCSTCRVV
jgi:ferredoxin